MTNLILVDVDYTLSPNRYPRDDVRIFDAGQLGKHLIPMQMLRDIDALPGIKMWLTTWGKKAEEVFQMGWSVANRGASKLDSANIEASLLNASRVVWFDDEVAVEIPGHRTLAIRQQPIPCHS